MNQYRNDEFIRDSLDKVWNSEKYPDDRASQRMTLFAIGIELITRAALLSDDMVRSKYIEMAFEKINENVNEKRKGETCQKIMR